MTDWMSLMPDELREKLAELGESPFRGTQLFEWLSKGASFDGMRTLPGKLRETLAEIAPAQPTSIEVDYPSADGSTIKHLFRLTDGHLVEGVLMRYHHGNTFCVSTQVGCRMGCRFCASTIDGRVRDLSAGEMLSMAALVNARFARDERRGVTNIVLMGNGEPLDNYDASVRFIRLAAEKAGMGISPRNVSLSTCGIVENIRRLAREQLPVTLSLSLHAADDETRRKIMPIANRYTIAQVLDACREYVDTSGRRLIIEYTLIDGVNDGLDDAARLAGLLKRVRAHVNLIPLNPIDELEWKTSKPASIVAFQKALEERGISVTRRRSLGGDVQGACGQLRRKTGKDLGHAE